MNFSTKTPEEQERTEHYSENVIPGSSQEKEQVEWHVTQTQTQGIVIFRPEEVKSIIETGYKVSKTGKMILVKSNTTNGLGTRKGAPVVVHEDVCYRPCYISSKTGETTAKCLVCTGTIGITRNFVTFTKQMCANHPGMNVYIETQSIKNRVVNEIGADSGTRCAMIQAYNEANNLGLLDFMPKPKTLNRYFNRKKKQNIQKEASEGQSSASGLYINRFLLVVVIVTTNKIRVQLFET